MAHSKAVAKKALRRAEHLRNAGDAAASLSILTYVKSTFVDYGDEMPSGYFKPRTAHQMALSLAELGKHEEAERHFKDAVRWFDPTNFIGRGRAVRDYGWWLYTQGNTRAGISKIKSARKLLMLDTSSRKRREREVVVTDGFIARTEDDLKGMRQVDKLVRGGGKWMYELDNLRHMIPRLPSWSKPLYTARAKTIECRMDFHENLQVLIEDIRYGKPVKALASFGARELQSLSPF